MKTNSPDHNPPVIMIVDDTYPLPKIPKFSPHDMLVYNISGGHKNGKERVFYRANHPEITGS